MIPTLVTELSFEPLDLPLTEPFAIATGAPDMAHNVLVRLRLADGTLGLGEAAPFTVVSGETQASTLEALAAVREEVLGYDARAWRPFGQGLAVELAAAPSARCGLELALLDALCRHLRMPLATLFGGAGRGLDIDMTVTAGDEAHAAASARAISARGIRTLKVKVGARSAEEDVQRMVAIRREAPEARLFVDANGAYTVAQARAFLSGLEAEGIALALFEQPVPREDWEGMAELTRSSRVPICADESARTVKDVLRLAREGGANGINLKLMKSGVVESLAMWSVARACGMELMMGGMLESVLAMSSAVHFAAGLGGFAYADLDTHLFIREHPFRGGLETHRGRVDVGHVELGHGVELGLLPL